MSTRILTSLFLLASLVASPAAGQAPAAVKPPAGARRAALPPELVDWVPLADNPVFAAAGPGHWDAAIRERGWILREDDAYHLWYTGYDGTHEGIKQLGYAMSADGVHWTRAAANPLCPGHYVEDMMVVHHGDTYYMFAEGPEQSVSQMLTSEDRLRWTAEGALDIRHVDGRRVERPFGTPTVWVENGRWYLFYECGDLGVWLATSRDPHSLRWTNVQDEPVLAVGPQAYDRNQIALDQIIKHKGRYYALYHASGHRVSSQNGAPAQCIWNTNIARSDDLVHWQKHSDNPLVEDNKSSAILVPTGGGYRLYTMHGQIDMFESPRK